MFKNTTTGPDTSHGIKNTATGLDTSQMGLRIPPQGRTLDRSVGFKNIATVLDTIHGIKNTTAGLDTSHGFNCLRIPPQNWTPHMDLRIPPPPGWTACMDLRIPPQG